MANGEYGHGKIDALIRPLGIGAIRPDDGGPPVIFPRDAVQGGSAGFDKLQEGEPVRYRKHPSQLGGIDVAQHVLPERETHGMRATTS